MWISPTDILIKRHRKQLKKLNKEVSKVCMALIQLGHYNFTVEFSDKVIVSDAIARVKNLPVDSKFVYLDVYSDGGVNYFEAGDYHSFEGISKTSSVKKDLLIR